MSHSSDNSSSKKLTGTISRRLSSLQDEIIKEWVTRVKKEISSAENLRSPIIVDTIPVFLGNLAESIDGKIQRVSANESNNVAEAHGSERARVTDYDPSQLVLEYNLLREIVLDRLSENEDVPRACAKSISRSFDEAIQKALNSFYLEYVEQRSTINSHLVHDVRTPLTSANISLSLMLRLLTKEFSEKTRDELVELIHKVQRNLKYSNELLEAVLDRNSLKNSHESENANFVSGEMCEVVKSAVDDMSDEARDRIHLSGQKVEGFWNIRAMRRVIENLVSNAFKYGLKDTLIEIKIQETQGRVLISVHNKGEKIDPEEINHIHRKFMRAEKETLSENKGWGLGLSFCKEVVEKHAGSLGVESSDENGTTFTIDIPLDPRGIKIKNNG